MKKLIFPTLLILLTTFFACKKKESTPTTNNTSTTGGSTTGGSTAGGTPAGLIPSTGGDYCSLQTTYRYTNLAGTVTKDSSVFASFYSAPVSSVVPTYVNGGTVTLNGTAIPYFSSSSFYSITSNLSTNISGTITWSTTGSGTVTPFSQSFIPSYPNYTGGNLLPDSCTKSSGITINISGVTNNQNSVSVYLYSGSNTAYKYILGSNGTVTFSASDLTSFSTNQFLTISINIANIYSATVGGIKRGFVNNIQYIKYSYLKP